MPAIWKTVRVFISSTFRDMQAERDWLIKRVFPTLRQRLEPFRIHLVDIDLRWGITQEQADNDQVLGLCLQQIDECRPFFLGLIGSRYGWVPSKFPVEFGKLYGWTQHHTGKSVTELEILHAVINHPTMQGRALFCFRSERFLADIRIKQQRRIYIEGPTDEEIRGFGRIEAECRAADRQGKLVSLKNQIRALSPPLSLFDGYPCTWENATFDPATKQPGRIGGLGEFGNWVIEKLERTILDASELQEHLAIVRKEDHDELADERDFHNRFIENRTRVYIGRQKLQDELRAFVMSAEAKPCLLTGPSGSGKSAALAKFVSVWREQQSQDAVITHFVGASPRSTSLREMLRQLCAEITHALQLNDEIKQDIRGLSDQFRELIAKVSVDHRLILVIDALNQLDETENSHSLYWLPWMIPPQVRLIVSCIDDPDSASQPALMAIRDRQLTEIKVSQLNDDECLSIIQEIPSVAAKTLDEEQIRLLIENKATRNPLFLLVSLEELRGFGSFDQLKQRIAELPQSGDGLTAVFQQVILRLCQDFNEIMVKDVLTLLASSRRGLSERELLDLIEGESVRIEESASDLFPILRQLRPYLQPRGPLLDFFHRHLAKATDEMFFQADGSVHAASHQRLASYFDRQDYFIESHTEGEVCEQQFPSRATQANLRKVDELPWQRLQAYQWDKLEKLLFDPQFLEAKVAGGLAYGLINDFITSGQAYDLSAADTDSVLRHLQLFGKALANVIEKVEVDPSSIGAQLHLELQNFDEIGAQVLADRLESSLISCCWIKRLAQHGNRASQYLAQTALRERQIHSLQFSVDGQALLFSNMDGKLSRWRWRTHELSCTTIPVWVRYGGMLSTKQFILGNQKEAWLLRTRNLWDDDLRGVSWERLWIAPEGTFISNISTFPQNGFGLIACISRETAHLLLCQNAMDSIVDQWPVPMPNPGNFINHIAVAEDGKTKAICFAAGEILFSTGVQVMAHPGGAFHCQFVYGGTQLASCGKDGSLAIWDLQGILLRRIELPSGPAECLAYCEKKNLLIVGHRSGFLSYFLFDQENQSQDPMGVYFPGIRGWVLNIAISECGSWLAVAGRYGAIRIFSTDAIFERDEHWWQMMAYGPIQQVNIWQHPPSCFFFDNQGRLFSTLETSHSSYFPLRCSCSCVDSGKRVIYVAMPEEIRILSPCTGEPVKSHKVSSANRIAMALNADGSKLAILEQRQLVVYLVSPDFAALSEAATVPLDEFLTKNDFHFPQLRRDLPITFCGDDHLAIPMERIAIDHIIGTFGLSDTLSSPRPMLKNYIAKIDIKTRQICLSTEYYGSCAALEFLPHVNGLIFGVGDERVYLVRNNEIEKGVIEESKDPGVFLLDLKTEKIIQSFRSSPRDLGVTDLVVDPKSGLLAVTFRSGRIRLAELHCPEWICSVCLDYETRAVEFVRGSTRILVTDDGSGTAFWPVVHEFEFRNATKTLKEETIDK